MLDEHGRADTRRSPWFSLEATHNDFPWVFENGNRPALVISTYEALAVLVGLKLFYREVPPARKTKVMVTPTWTDNRWNGSALNKLVMTRFTPSAVLTELASHMKAMSMKVLVDWAPRACNQED